MAVLTVESPAAEKRRSRRRALAQVPAIAEILVHSQPVEVLDVSAGGLLICGLRLPPGARSQLEIVRTDGPLRVYGRVLRSEVAAICGGRIRYRTAIAFDRPLEFIDQDVSEKAAMSAPEAGGLAEVIVCYTADESGLEQHLTLNGW